MLAKHETTCPCAAVRSTPPCVRGVCKACTCDQKAKAA